MTKTSPTAEAKAGDLVAIHGHHLGESERLGEILEVLGAPDHVHFRVRWDDDRESIFYPSSDAIVLRSRRGSVVDRCRSAERRRVACARGRGSEGEAMSTPNLINRPSDRSPVGLKQTSPRGTGETAVVRAEHLSKRFGDLLAVDDLTFSLERGTVTGFLGPNGAGKTTTLRMLLHLVQPSAGRALVFGRSYQDLERPAAQVGAVLEAADFHPGRSGRDHLFSLALALGRGARGGQWFRERERAAAERVDAVLDLVELGAAGRRRVGSYSLGMRQRLGLAAALLGNPDLLILDEPANGLDPEGVRWLRDFMRSFAADGKTVFVSSHVLAEVAQTVDDVIIINKGRLVTISPLAELTARRTGAVRVRAHGAHRLQAKLDTEGLRATLLDGDELLVEGAPSARIGEIAYQAGIPLDELVSESSSLEDVFLELTAEEPS